MTWQTVFAQQFGLAESPFWHPQERALYWVDIAASQIWRAFSDGGSAQSWDMPSEPGCIAPATRGGLVIALRHGIFRAREWGGALERVVSLDYETRTVRANDGKCDALGRLWVGTYDETKSNRAAALYSIDCRDGRAPQVARKAADALTGNGLAWSPDNRILYWADTSSHVIHAWDCDLAGNALSAHRLFHTFGAKPADGSVDPSLYQGRPDGAAVDVDGNYFVAMYEGCRVCQFAPDGSLLAEFHTPARCPTMVCFGGEDRKTLYLTTARKGRSAQELEQFPLSGGVFSRRLDTPGLPVNFFVE